MLFGIVRVAACVTLSTIGGQLVLWDPDFPDKVWSHRGREQRGRTPSIPLLGTITATCCKTQTLCPIEFCWTRLAPTAALIRAKYADKANIGLCCFSHSVFWSGIHLWPWCSASASQRKNRIHISSYCTRFMFLVVRGVTATVSLLIICWFVGIIWCITSYKFHNSK